MDQYTDFTLGMPETLPKHSPPIWTLTKRPPKTEESKDPEVFITQLVFVTYDRKRRRLRATERRIKDAENRRPEGYIAATFVFKDICYYRRLSSTRSMNSEPEDDEAGIFIVNLATGESKEAWMTSKGRLSRLYENEDKHSRFCNLMGDENFLLDVSFESECHTDRSYCWLALSGLMIAHADSEDVKGVIIWCFDKSITIPKEDERYRANREREHRRRVEKHLVEMDALTTSPN